VFSSELVRFLRVSEINKVQFKKLKDESNMANCCILEELFFFNFDQKYIKGHFCCVVLCNFLIQMIFKCD